MSTLKDIDDEIARGLQRLNTLPVIDTRRSDVISDLGVLYEMRKGFAPIAIPERAAEIRQLAQSLYPLYLGKESDGEAVRKAVEKATVFVDEWDKHVARADEKA